MEQTEINRELDKWIAENVMGWRYHIRFAPESWLEAGIFKVEVKKWHPTKSTSDAFQVVEKIHETWLFSKRQAYLMALQKIVSNAIVGLTEVDQIIAWPDLFFYITPKAICLAAKKVIESQKRRVEVQL